MNKKRPTLFKVTVFLTAGIFLLNSVSNALELSTDRRISSYNLLPKPLVFQKAFQGQGSAQLEGSVHAPVELLTALSSIAAHFLINKRGKTTFVKTIRDKFRNNRSILSILDNVDLEGVHRKRNIVYITYTLKEKKYEIKMCLREKIDTLEQGGSEWGVYERFGIKIKTIRHTGQKDLKGPKAADSNSIIEDIISDGKMIEIVMEEGNLKAYTVEYVNGYSPGITDPEEYRGPPFDISNILDEDEISNLTDWMLKHPWIGPGDTSNLTIKFRIALNRTVLRYKDKISNSNIAHAGFRDKAIYMGEALFKYIFQHGHQLFQREILEEDELQHLKGFDHGTPEQVRGKLRLVGSIMEDLKDILRSKERSRDLSCERPETAPDEKEERSEEDIEPEHEESHKGSLAECFRIIYEDPAFRNKPDISIDDLSGKMGGITGALDTADSLESLGILVEGTALYTYRLRKDIHDLPPEDIKKILAILEPCHHEMSYSATLAVKARIDMICLHHINMHLLPPVENGKILWHVVPIELVPHSLRSKFYSMIRETNRDYPHVKEKIKIVTEGQDMEEVINELIADPNNIVNAAVGDEEDLEDLPEGVKALVFEGELKNFRQLEGILAALRALYQNDVETLITIYQILTGYSIDDERADEITANIDDPKALADVIVFYLKPVEIRDTEDLRILNSKLLKFIYAA